MGTSSSRKQVNTSKVEFRIHVRDLRIQNFNQYSDFDAGFQQRFGPAIWDEFKQNVTTAIQQYTNDKSKTIWKSSYSTLTTISLIIGGLCVPALIYCFYGGLLGGIFGATAVWQSAVVLVILVLIWTIVYFTVIRQKLKNWKHEYSDNLEKNINNAMTSLNTRYNGQCRFDLRNILGANGIDVDFSISLRCCFAISLFVQTVQQNVNYGGMQYVQQQQQPQQVMIQMPDGTMQMAQIISQPVQQVAVPQQQYVQQVVVPQQQAVAYTPNAPPAYAPNTQVGEAEQLMQNEGGAPGAAANAAHTLQ